MELLALTIDDIGAMQAGELKTFDRNTLRDIRDVEIDIELPKKGRLLDYIQQIGNP